MTINNKSLHRARNNQYDEFYTQMHDIDNELSHYASFLKGKVVYCNCDNVYLSNFVKYFIDKYDDLGLQGFIASCIETEKYPAHYVIYRGEGVKNIQRMKGDGDFRSAECIDLLKQSDVVVTNPPFSLSRQHYRQIKEYNKDCIIMGNFNAVGYNDFFPDLKSGKLRVGWDNTSKTYVSPNNYIDTDVPEDKKGYVKVKDGILYVSISCVNWYTTYPIERNLPDIELKVRYNPELHPYFDNYNAIYIDKIKNIPCNYAGNMGVPITIFHFNRHQWEIIATNSRACENGLCTTKDSDAFLNGKSIYTRIFVKNRRLQG